MLLVLLWGNDHFTLANEKKASRIRYQKEKVSILNESDWPIMIEFLVDTMI